MEDVIKILVVDDEQVDRMAVKRALTTARVSFVMSEASSCQQAITALQQRQYDCVFLDYQLPDGDGVSFMQQVQNLGISVPMVILTGNGDERLAVQLIKAGAIDYLSKNNLTPDTLAQTLRQSIRLYKAEKEAELANQKLRESEERYRLVLEGANDGIWDWDLGTDEIFCNDKLLEIIGVSRREFQVNKEALIQLIHPEDLPTIKAALQAHLTRGKKCEVEFRIRHSSGKYRYCVAKGKAQLNQFGCPSRISGVISDITTRKQLEDALLKNEARLRRLTEANIIGIIIADMFGNIREANDAFLEMVGYAREDLNARRVRWRDMTPPEYQSLDEQALKELITTGVMNPIEKEYIRKDGSRVPIILGGAVLDELKTTTICFVVDLSERQRTAAQIGQLNRDLQHRVNELETLLDVLPIGIALASDPECRYIRINLVLSKLLNLPPNANASKSAPQQEQPSYKVYRDGRELAPAELPMQYATAQGVEVLNSELDVVVDDHSPPIKLLSNAAPLFDEQGKSRGSVAAFWDITERKQQEERQKFLAAASALLASSLDYQKTLENLAQLIVPQFADWCTIHLLENSYSLRLVTVAHSDPVKQEWATALLQLYPLKLEAPYGTSQVIKTGQSEFYPEIPSFVLEAIAQDAEHLEIMHDLGLKSMMCVPIKARGRTLGAISLISEATGCTYTAADLALAEDIAQRAGLAVENARLYREATDIGENLRQAILILGEQQQQLRILQQLTNLVNQRLGDLPDLLNVMVHAVCDAIDGAQFCLIVLHNEQTYQLELTATTGIGIDNLPLGQLTHLESGLLGEVFVTGVSKLFQNQHLTVSESSTQILLPASMYAVAIESAQAGRLGVLAIGNWQNANAFDLEDRNLLSAVGEQAGIAINNARMINTLEEREQRLAIQNEVLAQQNRQLEVNKQQIQLQNLQLLEAARLKSQFLATMSHELRTPLNAILGFAQVLLRQRSGTLSDHQAEMVSRILSSGNSLLALINDILDLAKIEAGRFSLQIREFNFTNLVTATVADYRQMTTEKQLNLQVQINLNNPLIINDNARLKQVLVNLLSNAIKFTRNGSVNVNVWEAAPDKITFCVQDTGIGIPESEVKQIFEKFRQIDQSITRQHGGTGLGLAITKSLVEMMQGSIKLESKVGQGSTFCVEIPRQVKGEENTNSPPNSNKSSVRMLF